MTDKNRQGTPVPRPAAGSLSFREYMRRMTILAPKYTEEDVCSLVRLAEDFAKGDSSPEMARLLDNVRTGAEIMLIIKGVLGESAQEEGSPSEG